MCKIGRIVLMTAGLIAMIIILVVFGFFETGIPRMGYLGMWIVCAGAIRYGAGAEDSKIEDNQRES